MSVSPGPPPDGSAAPGGDGAPLAKEYALSFENLSVHVPGRPRRWYAPLVRPFEFVAQEYLGLSVRERDPLYALTNVTGVLSSGELCLVLGSNDGSKVSDASVAATSRRFSTARPSSQECDEVIVAGGGELQEGTTECAWLRIQ